VLELIPAIDLRGGRCVRLYQGDYSRETVYGEDPAAMARHWQSLGAPRLHVVDLDGARDGAQANAAAVRAIVEAVDVPVELGGGIRDLDTVERWLRAGIERVFLGTAAVTNPDLVPEACASFPGRVAAGADARDGRIAVRGWEVDSGEGLVEFARRVIEAGVCAVSYTDVSRDGTLEGPNLDELRTLIEALPAHSAQIVLAGGIGSVDDIRRAAMVPGLGGVIVGRALYEGRVDLTEALVAVRSV
jgi:phosphoribosylformimino-5-aminoimidazole carboxamide ribotide isomerase